MAQVNKISSFKSFTEVKNQEATMKLRETNNAKRQETVGKIGSILDEMGLTSLSELDEEKKQALINKMFGNVSEDEAEDIEAELNKLGEPKKLEERNAFLGARAKAIEEDKNEFEFNGKTYKVTVNEGNAFGDAVRKAKEDGKKEFEFDGKTYKVEEGNAFGDAVRKAKEDGEKEFEFDGKTFKVEEAKRTKFTGKNAHDLYTQTGGKPTTVFVGNDWYSVDPKELKDNKGDSFTGYTKDGSDYDFHLKDIKFIQESVVNEGRVKAATLLQELIDGNTSRAEGIKMSKGLAEHYLYWLKNSAYGKKNTDIPLYMLIKASFFWGIERGLDPKLKKELEELKASQPKNELAVTEAFYRLPKDVIGTELYTANQNLQSIYTNTSAGSDVDPKALDSIIKLLQQVKSLTKKFNSKEEVTGTVYEGEVNEAEKFKSTKDFLDFCEEIDGMPENRIKKIMGKDYIDTPGGFRDEADDYDNDIEEYMISNMGKSDFNELKTWWENNVQESVVNEAIINISNKSIKEDKSKVDTSLIDKLVNQISPVLNSNPGTKLNEKSYREIIEAIAKSISGTGALQSTGLVFEGTFNEAEVKSDDEFKEYAMTVLKKAFGDDFDEAKATEVVDGILKKCGDDYGAAVGMLTSSLGESVVTEGFDANYWEDYHEGGDSTKMKNPGNFQLQQEVEACVEDWNDNNENGKENEVTSAGEKKVIKLAKDFVKAKGWISSDVIDAMIAQES